MGKCISTINCPMSNKHDKPEFWEANYRAGPRRWELGQATPVFRRLAASGQFAPGRMIVPGAGLGTTRGCLPATAFR